MATDAPAPNFARLLAASGATSLLDPQLARHLDLRPDSLGHLRAAFALPTRRQVGSNDLERADEPACYFAGNSLGLMPTRTPELVAQELKVWNDKAVLGHFDHPLERPWKSIDGQVTPRLAKLVGARPSETACMGSLTSNLHLLMASFYRPTAERSRILFEDKCFPSDMYAFASQARHHGLDPAEVLLPLKPRDGEFCLRTEDILDVIKREGATIAVVLFSGVQYYTGQLFDMAAITKAGRQRGCIVGFDLAHAVGNVPLRLHDWGVDFAVWCSYKYLNAGPGAIAGLYVHERHDGRDRLAGWWGHNEATRFAMPPTFDAMPGAAGFQVSNPCVLSTVALLGSLSVFAEAGGDMVRLRKRSDLLTGFLDTLLRASSFFVPVASASAADDRPRFTIITPPAPDRGAQLSLLFLPSETGLMERVAQSLIEDGIVGDERKPDVIRLAPAPLYTTFDDVRQAAGALERAMRTVHSDAL